MWNPLLNEMVYFKGLFLMDTLIKHRYPDIRSFFLSFFYKLTYIYGYLMAIFLHSIHFHQFPQSSLHACTIQLNTTNNQINKHGPNLE